MSYNLRSRSVLRAHSSARKTNSKITDLRAHYLKLYPNAHEGFKIFLGEGKKWRCLNQLYRVGVVVKMDSNPELCRRGFHYCEQAANCLRHYGPDPPAKFARVIALGKVVHSTNRAKSVTNELVPVEELSREQFLEHCTGWTVDESGNETYHHKGVNCSIDDMPAVVSWNGEETWKNKHEQKHRDKGPAVVMTTGTHLKLFWMIEDCEHRVGAPSAIRYNVGEKTLEFYFGRRRADTSGRHNPFGPAVMIFYRKTKTKHEKYALHGTSFSKVEWELRRKDYSDPDAEAIYSKWDFDKIDSDFMSASIFDVDSLVRSWLLKWKDEP